MWELARRDLPIGPMVRTELAFRLEAGVTARGDVDHAHHAKAFAAVRSRSRCSPHGAVGIADPGCYCRAERKTDEVRSAGTSSGERYRRRDPERK
jgi:hypothetical protein